MPKILIPDTFTENLPPLAMEVVRYPAKGPVTQGLDADALVVWNLGRKVLYGLMETMPNLRWVQALTAGVDIILGAPHKPQDLILTNGKGLHDAPTAELAVTLLLSAVRQMHRWRDLQHKAEWDDDAYNNQLIGNPFYSLEDRKILILGMGTIGQDIARRLQTFGCVVEGVAGSAGTRGGVKTHATSELLNLLPNYDAVISVLPETPETRGIIGKEFLAKMPRHAWLINVGRGSAVDEDALLDVLQEKRIGGAALDVFAKEPLPKESPLWACENLILTPHIAGGGPRFYAKAGKLLQTNAQAFVDGKPLHNVIDVSRGY